jgi:MoaA/NifB/PqqE/SkfB family radical SAM enzyme
MRFRKLTRKLQGGLAVLQTRFLGRRRPAVVGWIVTRRCNYQCRYCRVWESPDELDTPKALDLLDQITDAGTLVLGFTGGEPLVREDFGELVARALHRGLAVTLSTNGALVPDRIDELTGVDLISISLEGPKDVQDAIRGTGAFERAIAAVEIARSRDLDVELSVTINSSNVHRIPETLELASALGLTANFQPAIVTKLGSREPNPVQPEPEAYRAAMDFLHQHKRRRRDSPIGNSLSSLLHLARWPDDAWVSCAGGLIGCKVNALGEVYHCGRYQVDRPKKSAVEHGFVTAFESLPRIGCVQCWCASRLELNLVYQLNTEVILNTLLSH